jgi:calcium-dependent protein kinase
MPAEKAIRTVETIMTNADVNRSGYINYSEFILASANYSKLLSKANLGIEFSAFDKDNSGKISADQLKQCGGLESADSRGR